MYNDESVVKTEEKEIVTLLSELRSNIFHNQRLIQILGERLDPVLNDRQINSPEREQAVAKNTKTKLGNNILLLINEVIAIDTNLNDLLERLEL
jgi:hypothetical protein